MTWKCMHTKANVWVFTASIFIIAKLEAPKTSFSSWIKTDYDMTYHGTLSNDKKKWLFKKHIDMGESSSHISKWKKPIWKSCIVFDSICMPLWKRQFTMQKINNLVVSFKFLPRLLSAPTILTVYVRVKCYQLR